MMKKLIALLGLIICPLCFGDNDAEGVLEFVNVTNPFTYPGRMTIVHSFSGAVTDYFDDLPYDIEFDYDDLMFPATYLYSRLMSSGHPLIKDSRPADGSQDIFHLTLATFGNPIVMENWLVVNFYETNPPPELPPFGNKQIIFLSDHLKYGYAVDVRAVIDKGSFYPTIQLEDITGYGEYSSAWLLIGDGHYLADMNNDCRCDFKDYLILARDWDKPQGKHQGDISGQYGAPDGYVDIYDLEVFAEEWLTHF